MVTEGWITQQQRQQAKWPAFKYPKKLTLAGQNGYLMRMAQAEAAKQLNISEDDLRTGVRAFVQAAQAEAVGAPA